MNVPSDDVFAFRSPGLPGDAPGTLTIPNEAPTPMLRCISFGPGHHHARPITSLSELDTDFEAGHRVWLDVAGVGDGALLEALGSRFDLHPLALEDAVNLQQRPKYETYDHHDFLVMRMLRLQESGFESEQVSLFLSDAVVITIQATSVDCFDPVRRRLGLANARLRSRPLDYLAYCLVDAVVDMAFPALEDVGDRLGDVEEEVLAGRAKNVLEQIYLLRRELVSLRRIFWPLREALSAVHREDDGFFSEDTKLYLRDTRDHAHQVLELIDTYRELSGSLLDLRLSLLGRKANEVMKVLTLVATIFMPLSFLVGLYGMNFDTSSPWNMPELSWRYGYLALLTLLVLVAGGLIGFFARKGWLSD